MRPRSGSRLGLGLLCLVILTGCVSAIPLTKQNRTAVQSVRVNPAVEIPKDIYYQGPGQSAGAAFGMVGALIAAAAAEGPKGQLKAAMQAGEVDLGRIVRESFAAALSEARVFPNVVEDGAETEIRLEVRIYGFAQPRGFSSQLKPMIGVIGTLAGRDGKVMWQRYDYVTNLNGETPSHTLEEYLQDPERIRTVFTSASKIVAAELVKHIRGD